MWTKVTREQLYEEVWSKPLTHLAEQYGLSDRGLGKICTRLEIPLPGRGYWRKVELGQKVEKEDLPPPSDDCQAYAEFWRKESGLPKITDESPIVVEAKAFESKPENKIIVPERVTRFHPLVKESLASLLAGTPDSYGRCYTKGELLDIICSKETARRVARIFHVLIQSIERRGYRLVIHRYPFYSTWNPNPVGTFIQCSGEEVRISLMEQSIRSPHVKAKDSYWAPKYDYTPNGQLILKIESVPYSYGGFKQTWKDKIGKPLEGQLNSFMVGLARAAGAIRLDRLEDERKEREREAERQRQERLRQLRLEEEKRISDLDQMLSQWQKATQLRSFLEVVQTSDVQAIGEMPKEEWLIWAEGYLNKLDPFTS